MRYTSIPVSALVTGATLLSLLPIVANAQSNPPGQVTSRMRAALPPGEKVTDGEQTEAEVKSDKAGTPAINTKKVLFPLFHADSHSDDQIQAFFAADGLLQEASAVQYLYNAQQSSNAVSGDLLTATFQPGFQAILAGTATAGSGSTSSSSTSGTGTGTGSGTSTSTDSVQTAVSKIENGGDFNLRFPIPLLYHGNDFASVNGFLTPNLGFNVNGLGSQSTNTNTTEYTFNLPDELYAQFGTISKSATPAILFLDVKPAGEILSSALAQKIGPSVPKASFLGQASFGIEFSKSIRISFQYIYGNAKIYQSSQPASGTTTGSSTTAPASPISGFHLAVSFSPQKSKSSSSVNTP